MRPEPAIPRMAPATSSPAVTVPRAAASVSDRQAAQKSFLATMGRIEANPSATAEAQAKDAAAQWVAASLVQPLLKQLRDLNSAAPPFGPGPAEKQFGALMDADLAQRIVCARNFPLVDRVARQLLTRGSAAMSSAGQWPAGIGIAEPGSIPQPSLPFGAALSADR
jgi:Rod binding domain-containing protein